MSGAFDPYHRWLGIRVEEQPPHHYRLLGLAPFEEDPEVIRDAAERQMAHVRGYALGQHADLSQQILNELAAAKACLLEPAKKAEYDGRLRRDLGASKPLLPPLIAETSQPPRTIAAPPVPKRVPRKIGQRLVLAAEAIDTGGRARSDPDAIARRSLMVLGGSAVVLLVVLALVVIVSLGGTDNASSKGVNQRDQANASPHAPLRIRPIGKKTVFEGEKLLVPVEAEGRGLLAGELRYSLDPGPADGATIDPKTGNLTWTPGEKHGPGVYPITVRVAIVGSGDLRDQTTFPVEVRERNQAPLIDGVPGKVVRAGDELRFFVTASDGDQPPNKLEFALVTAPEWVQIDPSSGMVTCAPSPEHAGTSCRVAVRVSDNALPTPLYADRTIHVAVAAPQAGQPPVDSALSLAQRAAVSGDFAGAWEHLQGVQKAARSPQEFWPLENFLRAVRDQFGRVEALEELRLGDDVIASVVQRDDDKLWVMWQGRPQPFAISELPWELAVALAQRGLQQSDPATAISIAAFLAVDARGDYQDFVRRCTRAGLARRETPVPGPTSPAGAPFGPSASGPVPAPTGPVAGDPPQGLPVPASPPPLRKDYSITLPSGRELGSSLFDLSKQSIVREASDLLVNSLQGAGPRASHFFAGLSHPNGSLFALFRQTNAKRVIDWELDGVLITFYESPHMVESYLNEVARFPPAPLAPARPQRPRAPTNPNVRSAIWDDAYPKLYATYKDDRKDGWLKSWDEQFRKVYWCEYAGDRRHGLCCLFEDDALTMVLECEGDAVRAIHRILGGNLLKSFRDENEVKQDDDAGPVWERLVAVESQLGEYERSFKKEKREQEQETVEQAARAAGPKRRASMIGRSKERDATKNRYFGGQWQGALGRSGVE